MEHSMLLSDYDLTSTTAKAQSPVTVGLAVRDVKGDFEPLDIIAYSAPLDLPDVMKSQENNDQEQSS
ncbi:unnamed protein product [Diabrotica balteata]|uniref:Uncharacterized protein n=1 Tax=Diabrotica balteata TaxID=107213 RepID=A0A9N9X6P8_DIABA|nr:unnamed protein product [Diabrotica balteata]